MQQATHIQHKRAMGFNALVIKTDTKHVVKNVLRFFI